MISLANEFSQGGEETRLAYVQEGNDGGCSSRELFP